MEALGSTLQLLYEDTILPRLKYKFKYVENITFEQIWNFFKDFGEIGKLLKAKSFISAGRVLKSHAFVILTLVGCSVQKLLELYGGNVAQWISVKLDFCFQLLQCGAWIGVLLNFGNQCMDLYNIGGLIDDLVSEFETESPEINTKMETIKDNIPKLKEIFEEAKKFKETLFKETDDKKYRIEKAKFLGMQARASAIYNETTKLIDEVLSKLTSMEMRARELKTRSTGVLTMSSGSGLFGLFLCFSCPWLGGVTIVTSLITGVWSAVLRAKSDALLDRIKKLQAELADLQTKVKTSMDGLKSLKEAVDDNYNARPENNFLNDIMSGE